MGLDARRQGLCRARGHACCERPGRKGRCLVGAWHGARAAAAHGGCGRRHGHPGLGALGESPGPQGAERTDRKDRARIGSDVMCARTKLRRSPSAHGTISARRRWPRGGRTASGARASRAGSGGPGIGTCSWSAFTVLFGCWPSPQPPSSYPNRDTERA